MNKTLQEGLALATELNEALAGETQKCDVVIGVPFIHLATHPIGTVTPCCKIYWCWLHYFGTL